MEEEGGEREEKMPVCSLSPLLPSHTHLETYISWNTRLEEILRTIWIQPFRAKILTRHLKHTPGRIGDLLLLLL